MLPASEGLTVARLVELLLTKPQDLLVVHSLYSENCVLEANDVQLFVGCPVREDGWVPNVRPDKPRQEYLSIF